MTAMPERPKGQFGGQRAEGWGHGRQEPADRIDGGG